MTCGPGGGPARGEPAPAGRGARPGGRGRTPAPSCSRRQQPDGLDAARRTARRSCRRCGGRGRRPRLDVSATLCIVFVHSTSSSAPARTARRLRASRAAASSQPPLRWSGSISAKSTQRMRHSARMPAALAVARRLVDHAVVLGRRLPAHAAQEPDAHLALGHGPAGPRRGGRSPAPGGSSPSARRRARRCGRQAGEPGPPRSRRRPRRRRDVDGERPLGGADAHLWPRWRRRA